MPPIIKDLHQQSSRLSATELYRTAYMIRQVEMSLLGLFSQGKIRGTTHTCLGQETCAAAVVLALDQQKDIVISNHRSHGHYLCHTGDLTGLFCEVMGKRGGPCGGVGGSQHLYSPNFYSSGILGGTAPLAIGVAMAEKMKKTGAVTVIFLGDGAMAQGVVYEAFNVASLWSLPILFVVECNQFAQSTRTHVVVAGKIADRPSAFGIDTNETCDDDGLALFRITSAIVDKIRNTDKPHALVIQTYRLGPHSKGDDDRTADELARHWDRDPLRHLGEELPGEQRVDIERAVEEAVSTALAAALGDSEMSWESFSERAIWA